jgi:hypothetical protein
MNSLLIVLVILLKQFYLMNAQILFCDSITETSTPSLRDVCGNGGQGYNGNLISGAGNTQCVDERCDAATCCSTSECCELGQIRQTDGRCQNCDEGRVAVRGECSFCNICKMAYSASKSTECKICGASPGEYWQRTDGSVTGDCVKCDMGKIKKALPSKEIERRYNEEPKGFISDTQSLTCAGFVDEVCKPCDATLGRYSNEFGQQTCKICPNGKSVQVLSNCEITEAEYSENLGTNLDYVQQFSAACSEAQFCVNCVAGMSGEDGECKRCQIGMYQVDDGQTACQECPPGQYQDEVKKISCKNCPAGRLLSTTGGTAERSCRDCLQGRYQDSLGSLNCKACNKGQHQDASGQPSCKTCVKGRYAKDVGLGNW